MGWTLGRLSRCDEARAHFLTLATQNPNHAGGQRRAARVSGTGFCAQYVGVFDWDGVCRSLRTPRRHCRVAAAGTVIDGKFDRCRISLQRVFPANADSDAGDDAPGMPPRPGVPPMPPMTTTVTTISSTTFDQHEAYLHAGYSGTRLSLIARYAFLVDSRGLSQASHHAGLGLRISPFGFGDAQLQFATSVYSRSDDRAPFSRGGCRLPRGFRFSSAASDSGLRKSFGKRLSRIFSYVGVASRPMPVAATANSSVPPSLNYRSSPTCMARRRFRLGRRPIRLPRDFGCLSTIASIGCASFLALHVAQTAAGTTSHSA